MKHILTQQEKQDMDFITGFIEGKGYLPNIQDVADFFAVSKIKAWRLASKLVEKGHLKKDQSNRPMTLTPTKRK